MLSWLDTWQPSNFSRTLTRQTRTALSHTLHGLLEITKYCFDEPKSQTDPLEDRFGKYRQMAGGHYHISVYHYHIPKMGEFETIFSKKQEKELTMSKT